MLFHSTIRTWIDDRFIDGRKTFTRYRSFIGEKISLENSLVAIAWLLNLFLKKKKRESIPTAFDKPRERMHVTVNGLSFFFAGNMQPQSTTITTSRKAIYKWYSMKGTCERNTLLEHLIFCADEMDVPIEIWPSEINGSLTCRKWTNVKAKSR